MVAQRCAIGKLVHYADAVSLGSARQPAAPLQPELDRLGHPETMRRQLDGKAYIESYVHSLTHELKSPLAAIRGGGDPGRAPPPDIAKRFIGNINLETARMQQLIEAHAATLACPRSGQGLDRQSRRRPAGQTGA